jgi:hypothetical protein
MEKMTLSDDFFKIHIKKFLKKIIFFQNLGIVRA